MPFDQGTKPIRRATPVTFSLDEDARALLRAMQSNSKSYGCLVSELIRKEAERRARRPALLVALALLVDGSD